MKHLRVILGLALIPLCALLGSFVPIGTGSGTLIGLVVGIALSYLFLAFGPGRKKSHLPTSYYLNHQHEVNGGVNPEGVEKPTPNRPGPSGPPAEVAYPPTP